MSQSLPLGSYVSSSSPLHRLDTRVKVVLIAALAVAAFVAPEPVGLVVLFALLAWALASARLGAGIVVRGLRPTVLILAFSLIANSFVLDGTGDIVLAGPWGISVTGVVRGLVAVGRVVVLVGFTLVLSSTSTTDQVADAIASFLSPLRHLGVPVDDTAMTVSLALRFIPECVERFDRIRDAQRARGANFDTGSLAKRLRLWTSVFVPLIVSLFADADELARAMRDRCYGGSGRTRLTRPLRAVDVCVLIVGLVLCVVLCVVPV